jgi:hypothetical protein
MPREVYADLDVNGNKVINVATPVAATDAANKQYVLDNAGGSTSSKLTFVVGDTSAIATGVKKAYITCPRTGNITAWKIISDVSATASIQVLKSTTMPTFTAVGTASMTAARTATGTPSWAVTSGDIMNIEVLTNDSATQLVLEITIT